MSTIVCCPLSLYLPETSNFFLYVRGTNHNGVLIHTTIPYAIRSSGHNNYIHYSFLRVDITMSSTPSLVLITGPTSAGKTRYINTVVTKMKTTRGLQPITLAVGADYSNVKNNTVQFSQWTADGADAAWTYIQQVYNGVDNTNILYVQTYTTPAPDYITSVATTTVPF